jgi:imidazolonepropionase
MMQVDRVWRNTRLATLVGPGLGVVPDGIVACRDRRIAYAGPAAGAPAFDAADEIDCEGRWTTPGLVDCHTHLVFGGDRAAEFEQRLAGASYEDIAAAGGGIRSTVRATRAATEDELVGTAARRLDHLIAEGATTVEVKSGYGLETETEVRMLRAAGRLAGERPIRIVRTFLGAHTVPEEFSGNADGYVDLVCRDMLPVVATSGLAEAVDVFCERIAFSPRQTSRVFEEARRLGLHVKLHADQLSNTGGAQLAASFRALSADHVEHTNREGAAAMGAAGTVAVLLPGAYYTLRDTHPPPIDAFRRHGVPMAVATDCNPGTSPLTSILLALNMAATLFRLTVDECVAGATREAARALGLLDEIGTLEAGKWCDLAIWDIDRPAELVYRIGFNPLRARVWHGHVEA